MRTLDILHWDAYNFLNKGQLAVVLPQEVAVCSVARRTCQEVVERGLMRTQLIWWLGKAWVWSRWGNMKIITPEEKWTEPLGWQGPHHVLPASCQHGRGESPWAEVGETQRWETVKLLKVMWHVEVMKHSLLRASPQRRCSHLMAVTKQKVGKDQDEAERQLKDLWCFIELLAK